MGPADLDRMLTSLEAGIAAARAADEDAAADDLAFSLSQDIDVETDLVRTGGWLVVEGTVVPVRLVGHDFVTAGCWIVPLDRAVVRVGLGIPAGGTPDVLVGLLRRLARGGGRCVVGAGGSSYGGRVTKATPNRITVRGIDAVSIPLARLDYVRLVPSDSADVL